jgi:hypothetical protein
MIQHWKQTPLGMGTGRYMGSPRASSATPARRPVVLGPTMNLGSHLLPAYKSQIVGREDKGQIRPPTRPEGNKRCSLRCCM